MKRILGTCLVLLLSIAAHRCYADTFGSGPNSFQIDFVTIGDPGNPPDTTGDPNPAGSVPYVYRIGKYEIPEDAVRKANAQSALDGQPLGITLDSRGPDKPATSLSWFEAAQFVNWLNTSTGHTPAYKFDGAGDFQLWEPGDPGYDASNLFRNKLAKYVLPSDDEWYKAAYYDPVAGHYWDYPTGSDDPPIPVEFGTAPGTAVWNQPGGPADVMLAGGASPYGTVGQAGNVVEYEETEGDLVNDSPGAQRGERGASWIVSLSQ
jgi:sulfatase modifying factor 1